MSNDRRGPGWPASGYGPVKTVLAQPAFVDEAAPPAVPPTNRPPSTLRDLPASAPIASPQAPPPPPSQAQPLPAYPPPPPPYGVAPQVGYPRVPQIPYGVPPPPPRPAGRGKRGGPSLLVIGAVSAVVIGSAATGIAIALQDRGDDRPAPTLDVPPSSAAADPPPNAAEPSDPATADPPTAGAAQAAGALAAASADRPNLKLGKPAGAPPLAPTAKPVAPARPGGAQIGVGPTTPRPGR